MTGEEMPGTESRDDGWVDTLRRERLRRSVRNPGLAALMSFCVMGLGQIYAGHIDRGIILMMMHLATAISGYSLYTRGFLYDMVAPHFGPAAIVAVAYVAGVVIILAWIYNIKDAYYRSLFSGLRDWFEVERVLIPHLKDGGASHLLGAPVPPRARLTGPSAARTEAAEEADEATVIEVARQENATVARSAGTTSDDAGEVVSPKEQSKKKRSRRTSDKPAAAMADALEEATGVGRNWRFTLGLLVIFLLVGVWMFNRQHWNFEDLRPSSTLFSISTDAESATGSGVIRAGMDQRMAMRRAVGFLETGSVTAAIGAFEEIVKRPDAPVEAWKGLLRAYHRDERMGAYEDALVRYLKAFPDDADEWVTLGKLQYDRRAYVEASRSMLKCLAKDPAHLRGNYMMGAIYRELGLAEDAIPHLRKAQSGDPLNPEFNRELGAAFLEAHDLKNARRHLEKALSIDQQDEVAQRLLEDVDAEERRTGAGISGGVGYGGTPWVAAAPFSPGAGMEQSLPPAIVPAQDAAPAVSAAPAPSQQPIPARTTITPQDDGGPRGRGVVLYVAPGLKGGQALPDLPDTLLKTGTSGPVRGPDEPPANPVFAGLSNPSPELFRKTPPASEPRADAAASPVAASATTVPEPAIASHAAAEPPPEAAKETPRAEPKTPERVAVSPEPQKKTVPEPKKTQEDLLANAEAVPDAASPKSPSQTASGEAAKMPAAVSQKEAVEVSPLEKQRIRGVNAYLRGRWEAALPELLGYLKKKEDPDVYEMVGLIFQKLGSHDDAYEASKRASQLGMREPAFIARLGLMAAGLGKWEDGTRYLSDALQKLPHRIDLRLHLARCLRNSGDTDAARIELGKVLNEPNQTYAIRRRAEQEMEQLGIRIHPVGPGNKAPEPRDSGKDAEPKTPAKPAASRNPSGSAPPGPSAAKAPSGIVPANEPGKPVASKQPAGDRPISVSKQSAGDRPVSVPVKPAVPKPAVSVAAPNVSSPAARPQTAPAKKILFRSDAAGSALGTVLFQKPLSFGKPIGAASGTGDSLAAPPDAGAPTRW